LEKVIENIRKDVKSLQVTNNELGVRSDNDNGLLYKRLGNLEQENLRLKNENTTLKTTPAYKKESIYRTRKLEQLVDQFVNFFDRNVTSRKELRRRYDGYDVEGMMDELDFINTTYSFSSNDGREGRRMNPEFEERLNDTRKTLNDFRSVFK
jgi:hypothetical protein